MRQEDLSKSYPLVTEFSISSGVCPATQGTVTPLWLTPNPTASAWPQTPPSGLKLRREWRVACLWTPTHPQDSCQLTQSPFNICITFKLGAPPFTPYPHHTPRGFRVCSFEFWLPPLIWFHCLLLLIFIRGLLRKWPFYSCSIMGF